MLSTDTKRKIDNARDALVGKIPNPQTQIEQITTALIYKFMDDMDERAKAMGGKARFFVGDFDKYSWRSLLDPRMGGQERMNLYSEAVQKLSQNPNLPQLFRDIFKDVFVPYRDPETLSFFLKEINWFDYHHSEELGNAFEYLLSVMGSQGDAGQFRTPRHIIDFIVEAVDPQKDETVLDPACGTAGFLISAYKHILRQNDGIDDVTGLPSDKEIKLTPEERAKLLKNFSGYDISPEMVKLSLVNMYLHGFVAPNIEEYDSLTYEDHWSDDFDIILANPPFMTPKGGVRPHKRFQIQANRAELLFVDYIAEHLKPKGRAGVVVPEGIIFQSGKAYRALRKMIVEEQGLWAVISLPSGVFNPYAGVKTSVLIFDRELAKKNDEILFLKITNDGYSLGAQRKPVSENDLPDALDVVKMWKVGDKVESELAHWVPKKKISANPDYNLTGSRYKEGVDENVSSWDLVKIGDIARIDNGNAFKSKDYTSSGSRVIRITNVQKGKIVDYNPKFLNEPSDKSFSKFILNKDDLLISLTGNVGRVGIIGPDLLPALLNQRVARIVPEEKSVDKEYLFHIINSDTFEKIAIDNSSGIAQKNLSTEWIKQFRIPLPPLNKQKQIATELKSYQKIIDGAQQVVDNWRPTLPSKAYETRLMSEIGTFEYGIGEPALDEGEYRYIRITDINDKGYLRNEDKKFVHATEKSDKYLLSKGDILVARTGATFGKTLYFDNDEPSVFAGFLIRVRFNEKIINPKYFWYFAQSNQYWDQAKNLSTGGGQPQFNVGAIKQIEVPIPPLEDQEKIIQDLLQEENAVRDNEMIVDAFKKRIDLRISEVWGE